MKRKLSLVIVAVFLVAACFTALSACAKMDAYFLETMRDDLRDKTEICGQTKAQTYVTNASFTLPSSVKCLDEKDKEYSANVSWAVVGGNGKVTLGEKTADGYVVTVPAQGDSDVTYVLVATLTDAKNKPYSDANGNPYAVEFSCKVAAKGTGGNSGNQGGNTGGNTGGNQGGNTGTTTPDGELTATMKYSGTTTGELTSSTDIGLNSTLFTITTTESTGTGSDGSTYTNKVAVNKAGTIRLYSASDGNGNSLTVTINGNYIITKIEVTLKTDTKTDGAMLKINDQTPTSANVTSIPAVTVNGQSFTLQNVTERSGKLVWIDSIVIYYKAA